MKRSTFETVMLTLAAVLLATAGLAWADRTDVWSASSVSVQQVVLAPLADGGCVVTAYATYLKADGGTSGIEHSAAVEVAGANRTTCLDVLQNKAPILFKADRGL